LRNGSISTHPNRHRGLVLRFLTPFRHLSKRVFIRYRWGPGEAECGASAEGWRERPALALSARGSAYCGFDFSAAAAHAIRAILAAIGPQTYTDVQWHVTTPASYAGVVRPTERLPRPPIPAFRFYADLRIPIPRCPPARLSCLISGTPGVRAPRGSKAFGAISIV
jgi:hypothetical protein